MIFLDLPPGTIFRTGEIEVPGGFAHREFVKRSETTASDAADEAIVLKFHRLCPVWPL